MTTRLIFALLFVLMLAAGTAQAGGDAARGAELAVDCADCHGEDGMGDEDNPKLAGMDEAEQIAALKAFASGERVDELEMMGDIASGLSEQDMADLAAYFAEQSKQMGAADETLVEQGEKIYRGGNAATGVSACIGCHGPTGAGNPAAKFPAISGQHAKYVVNQLKAFQAGQRANDAGKMMRNVAVHMSPEEMEAVASYIQGLH